MFAILSDNLGLSTRTYVSAETALHSAREAWKRNPDRVGMCRIVVTGPCECITSGYSPECCTGDCSEALELENLESA